ncbi:MFS general substrate transporter [Cylindrobasidium torrendii FP15055 ss-10]|uniref:MFS general substrate transporter n=1 Tax=Cylindrobasidium torrendii FP15055 ss-10 TaxID=1314674 RepID=A0A0D7BCH2_9AGAR|nr:MFS general substrate transporter [Cylindrobasidium torrendii FP15055 ss-10]
MVPDIIRDSTIGGLVRYFSGNKYLLFADERADFVIPALLLPPSHAKRPSPVSYVSSDRATLVDGDEGESKKSPVATPFRPPLGREATLIGSADIEKLKELTEAEIPDPYLVDWYGPDDPDNPKNWSGKKRAFVTFNMCLLTFAMYIGSAIYTPSIPGIMEEFGISLTHATLGLTLYVLGYGMGPMFLTPFQELAAYGRNTVYILTMFLFVIFQIPIITARNVETIMAFRFLTGFVGSPVLATGGATLSDMYNKRTRPYVLGLWSLGATLGPTTGPVMGGFAAMAMNWRWPLYEMIWISAFAFVFLCLLMPETYGPTILLKRAERLRKLTGNEQLRTQDEKDNQGETVAHVFLEAIYRPFVLCLEPMLMFTNIYIGFVYAIFYLWFESFPIVFTEIHGLNLGMSGLPFLGFIVSGTLCYTCYCLYQRYHIAPRFDRIEGAGKEVPPEIRLEIGIVGSILIPVSVLIFGFTAKESISPFVSVFAAALYLPGIYLVFQGVVSYLCEAYPDYESAVLAGNDLVRSSIAGVFPLFGHLFFTRMGLGPACAILASVSFVLILGLAGFWKWGYILRARSKYAHHDA